MGKGWITKGEGKKGWFKRKYIYEGGGREKNGDY